MTIAIITPFYKGNKYMPSYFKAINSTANGLSSEDKLYVIMVNDSPDIDIDAVSGVSYELIIITNPSNQGIHKSRVNGLEAANKKNADLVIFLDQDDILSEDALSSYKDMFLNYYADIYISDYEIKNSKKIWHLPTFISVGNQITSPGQCAIRPDAIPDCWKEHFMSTNCADDYFLWILMMNEKKTYKFIKKSLYTHVITGENISENREIVDASIREMADILGKNTNLSKALCKKLYRMEACKRLYREASTGGKLLLFLKYPDIMCSNIIYRLSSGK